MSRDIKFLLLVMAGVIGLVIGVALLCLLPGYMGDSGYRECMRWLRSSTNQEALRQCAQALLNEYPEGTEKFGVSGVPNDHVPDLVRRIPPPRSGWMIQVTPSVGAGIGHITLVSLGGFGSYALYVGNTNLVIEASQKIAPGIYVKSSG